MIGRDFNAKDVESFIANAPIESQATMREIRRVIKAAAPRSEEVIAWGMPCYKHQGYLVGYSPLPRYISFGLINHLPDDARKILDEKGYKTGNKSFQIRFDQEVPVAEIEMIVQVQIVLNEAAKP